MSDQYESFAQLAECETEGIDYSICVIDRESPIAIVAPHGGEIEPGTSQIATAIASDTYSLYCFEGLVPKRPHRELHIASGRFDEPKGCRLVKNSEIVVGVHGRKDDGDGQTVCLGGLDDNLRDAIGDALERVGFKVKTTCHRLPGRDPKNICNRGRRKAGAQLEIPRTLRNKLVADASCRQVFSSAVREGIIISVEFRGHLT